MQETISHNEYPCGSAIDIDIDEDVMQRTSDKFS